MESIQSTRLAANIAQDTARLAGVQNARGPPDAMTVFRRTEIDISTLGQWRPLPIQTGQTSIVGGSRVLPAVTCQDVSPCDQYLARRTQRANRCLPELWNRAFVGRRAPPAVEVPLVAPKAAVLASTTERSRAAVRHFADVESRLNTASRRSDATRSRRPRIAGWSVLPRAERQASSCSHASVRGSPTSCSSSHAVMMRSLTRSWFPPRSTPGSSTDSPPSCTSSINPVISISSTPRFRRTTPSPLDSSAAMRMCGRHRQSSCYPPFGAGAVLDGRDASRPLYPVVGIARGAAGSLECREYCETPSASSDSRGCHPPSLLSASGRHPMHLIRSVRPVVHRHKPPRVVPAVHSGAVPRAQWMVTIGACRDGTQWGGLRTIEG